MKSLSCKLLDKGHLAPKKPYEARSRNEHPTEGSESSKLRTYFKHNRCLLTLVGMKMTQWHKQEPYLNKPPSSRLTVTEHLQVWGRGADGFLKALCL